MEDSTKINDLNNKKLEKDLSTNSFDISHNTKKKSDNKNIISSQYNNKSFQNINVNKILYKNKSWRRNTNNKIEKKISCYKNNIKSEKNKKIPNICCNNFRKKSIKKFILKASNDNYFRYKNKEMNQTNPYSNENINLK